MVQKAKESIAAGRTILGIELGSTRIKAVLIDEKNEPLASGSFDWENRFENGIWTYHLEDVWKGLQACYRSLADQVMQKYGEKLIRTVCIGISAMMHGYLAFDKQGELLTPFRTWRNTITADAARELTDLFSYHVPQRWSVAHLWQAVCNGEEHVDKIDYLTTLAGYVHRKLTGKKVLGIGDASGMFPIDSRQGDYDSGMIGKLEAKLREKGASWKLKDILPDVLTAGEPAGFLTEQGAKLLDPTGNLQPGIPFCPPEGDAGTGMTATNSVAVHTGNVSAGTSIFAMVVLERPLENMYAEIDPVTTPAGQPVAMVHCNNCTSDINAWAGLLCEAAEGIGRSVSMGEMLDLIFQESLSAEKDCGGILSYNYDSGEPITGFAEGRPLLVRLPGSRFSLANFGRTLLFSALASLRIGMDILFEKERVEIHRMTGHGGFFKAKLPGQRSMAAALGVPVSVMETAGEGGAWGIALLAAYCVYKKQDETLEHYLQTQVFSRNSGMCLKPNPADEESFHLFLKQYQRGLPIQQAAVERLRAVH